MMRCLAIFLVLASVTIAGTVSGPGRVHRLPVTASAVYQPPGYAASTLWLDGSWTNSLGHIPDLSASATNHGYPNTGGGQPTPTNFPAGNSCWYFNGDDGIMVTNSPFQTGSYLHTNATFRVWAYRLNNTACYIDAYYNGASLSGFYYSGGWGFQYNGSTFSLGNPPASNWTCFVATESRSGSTATLNVWTNAVLVVTNANVSVVSQTQSGFAQLGRNTTAANFFLTGYIDEPYRCTNYVWSGLEVTNDFNQMKPTFGL